jgi:hypothetical protein
MSQERPTSDRQPIEEHTEGAEELDTEGSSMLVYDLGLTTEAERRRQAEQASRDRTGSGQRPHRRLVDRIRRR